MRNPIPPLSLQAWLRFDAIEQLLPHDAQTLLEIGAGQGAVGTLLARRFTYVGLEPDPASFRTAARRLAGHGQVLNGTGEEYESYEPFDLVCAFEVLEHIEDDESVLRQWLRHLRPGGWALVSVPQGKHRFGPQDVWVGHCRRYDRADLESLLHRVGLRELSVISYGFPAGYVLDTARNVIARRHVAGSTQRARTAASGRWLQPPDWAALATRAATFPFRLAQRPFAGTSLGTGLVARGRLAGVLTR